VCSIVILKKSENEWPLIIAVNRDEMNNRKSLPPDRHWKDKPHIFAGKDLLAGGSWLGVNDNGVCVAIMNRKNSLGFAENKKSRGELVLKALDHEDANKSLKALEKIQKNQYRTFNMFIGDNLNSYWIKSDETSLDIECNKISDGLSMITSYDRNDFSSNRIKNYLPKFSLTREPNPTKNEWSDWEKLLGSKHREDDNPLSAMCIKTDMGFQTVSSAFIALPSSKSKLNHKPIFRYAGGSPDCTSFNNLKL